MNAIVLIIPILLIRYFLLGMISKEGLKRAGFYPPEKTIERIFISIYQITTIFLLIYLFWFKINIDKTEHYLGLFVYILGTLLYMKSVIDFSKPNFRGINENGLYKYSRNPMYVAFFLYFLGCGLIIESWIYLAVLFVFQISVHFLILSEERWCTQEFGEDYTNYMRKVRRYF